MEPIFQDKILVCTECSNDFVFTISQQRLKYEETGTVPEPTLCIVCQIKRERMTDHRTSQQALPTGRDSPAESATAQASSETPVSPAQPNNSTNTPETYQSGEAHPLHGHNGEVLTGAVKWFNRRKGFGFITLDNNMDIFVHQTGIADKQHRTLRRGQRVQITVEDTTKGPQASLVTVIDNGTE